MVKRGSVLITALLLVAVITVLALALLAKNTLQHTGAERQAASVRAYQMALAGLEDVRVKLDLDTNYPPLSDPEQTYFSYTETVLDLDGVTPRGSFEVQIDQANAGKPYFVYRILSIGTVGPAEDPLARRAVMAEFDVAPDIISGKRGDNSDDYDYSNPDYWTFVGIKDLGNY